MLKYIFIFVMLLVSVVYATPSVQDIQRAMHDENNSEVVSLSQEVINKYPGSAKAHYFLAQGYAHENKFNEASNELRTAKGLDPDLTFAVSPQAFYSIEQNINTKLAAINTMHNTNNNFSNEGAKPEKKTTHWFLWGLLIGVIFCAIHYWVKNKKKRDDDELQASLTPVPMSPDTPNAPGGMIDNPDFSFKNQQRLVSQNLQERLDEFQTQGRYRRSGGSAPIIINNPPPSNLGPGMGFGGGLAAGMLGQQLLDRSFDRQSAPREENITNNYYPDTSSNSTSSSNYDSGSGSDWNSSNSSSSSDSGSRSDSSSSYDSSSSSSYDSGSSSYDSGNSDYDSGSSSDSSSGW